MFKKLLYLFLLGVVAVGCGPKESPVASFQDATLAVVPRPVSTRTGTGRLTWDNTVTLVAHTEGEKKTAALLQTYLTSQNITATVADAVGSGQHITLKTVQDSVLQQEGYRLTVLEDGATLEANTDAGLFYGVQTLLQLIGAEGKSLPYLEIVDYPRFAYRGLHLDVGRHMFPPAFIKKYIDLMACHKFNRFHWHLTEDQGWRIEIKKYPKLQEIAAYRKETVIGHAGTADRNNPKHFDGKRYGGYYTQEEVKEIVAYATERHVTVIPEIEMPGHALAALSAYPELGCTGGPYAAGTTWGVFDDVFCAGKEETFTFLEGVLDEVVALFPGQYVHIGGDECPKTRWEKCPLCQKRMKAEGLKDTHELQSYFIQRIEKYLATKNRRIIGWDEILEGGLAPNATVMSWRGEEGGIAAAQQHHDVIMTPGNWCYFDHYQDSTNHYKDEPLAIGGYTPVSEVYGYEPLPPQLSADLAKYVLGAQANVWTEYIPTPEHAEYMVYPRACAMAEVLWTPKDARQYDNFLGRLGAHLKRLDAMQVNYAKHILKDVEKVSTSAPAK